MLLETLFVIAETLSIIGKCLNKLWCGHTVEYYTAVQKELCRSHTDVHRFSSKTI